ncbi:hypothetical protein AMECASPLE_034918 [Ameca splendens]|uniref:Uncharacterized protein n=1 Tax=Ameca splendens TaxID=208324 RepID=A0ABV0Z584_9TELE
MRMPVHQQRDSERLQEEDGGAQHFSESQAGRMRLWTFSAVLLSLFGSDHSSRRTLLFLSQVFRMWFSL